MALTRASRRRLARVPRNYVPELVLHAPFSIVGRRPVMRAWITRGWIPIAVRTRRHSVCCCAWGKPWGCQRVATIGCSRLPAPSLIWKVSGKSAHSTSARRPASDRWQPMRPWTVARMQAESMAELVGLRHQVINALLDQLIAQVGTPPFRGHDTGFAGVPFEGMFV